MSSCTREKSKFSAKMPVSKIHKSCGTELALLFCMEETQVLSPENEPIVKRFVNELKNFFSAATTYVQKEFSARIPGWRRSAIFFVLTTFFAIFAVAWTTALGFQLLINKGLLPFQAAAWITGGFLFLTILFYFLFTKVQALKSTPDRKNADAVERSAVAVVSVARDVTRDIGMAAKQVFDPKEILRKNSPQIALGALISGFLMGVLTTKEITMKG